MPELKWKSFVKASPHREYLALISYLPLKSLWKLAKFVRYTLAIQTQLKESRGLVGYSLLAQILQGEFWTLSVWEDEHTLLEFVRTGVHKQTMEGLRGNLGATKFVRWKISGSALPPSWQQSLQKLA